MRRGIKEDQLLIRQTGSETCLLLHDLVGVSRRDAYGYTSVLGGSDRLNQVFVLVSEGVSEDD